MSVMMDYSREPEHSALLTVRGTDPYNAEPALADLARHGVTPEHLFYCRNHSPIFAPPGDMHMIHVDGEVEKEFKMTLGEMKQKFGRKEVVAVLQCAGNRRMNMAVNTGKAVKGIPWEDGAVSNGRWAGIPLRDVLLYAGVKLDPSSANAHVHFANLDKCQDDDYYGGSIPLDKALDEDGDVLLATDMNGTALSPDRGFPLRVVIPGIYGMRWVKWVDKITVSKDESPNYYQQRDYKVLPEEVDTPQKAKLYWDKVPAMQYLSLNSAVCSVEVAETTPEDPSPKLVVRGYAINTFLPRQIIPLKSIDVSLDEGKTWHPAETVYHEGKWSWTLWEATCPIPTDREESEVWSRAQCGLGRYQIREGESRWNMRGVGFDGMGVGRWSKDMFERAKKI